MATRLAKFDFKQGFHRESTQYEEEGKWYDGNRVRFRSGKPENMRGYETRVSSTFDGSARDLMPEYPVRMRDIIRQQVTMSILRLLQQ